ncbi:expressed unknown protein [Seminavis robusta]|uniref:Uncharacterized protein n=1 Tax=Seminavis robusta TaxID=568900 RepID=A0A9N8EU21_9STRA|nr:expressed unknown protein [Seminavis robusta]|eukprot:Sro1877_g303090.1 n/a (482) ;mRNA; r:7118-8563
MAIPQLTSIGGYIQAKKFVKDEARRFKCLSFSSGEHGDPLILAIKIVASKQLSLNRDITLLEGFIEQGLLDRIAGVKLTLKGPAKKSAATKLFALLGQLRDLEALRVEAKPPKSSAKRTHLQVEALAAFFESHKRVSYFAMAGSLEGDQAAFQKWANAITKSKRNSLRSFDYQEGGSSQPSERAQSPRVSKWDPVIRAAIYRNSASLSELIISHGGPSQALTKKTSRLAAHLRSPVVRLVGFRPRFSKMEELVVHCVNQAKGLAHFRYNFYVPPFTEADNGSFLHDLNDKANICRKQFSLEFRCGADAHPRDIDVCLTKDFVGADMIHDLLSEEVRLQRSDITKISLDVSGLPCPSDRQLSRHNLWKFDPERATDEQWVQMLAVLGRMSQDAEVDLDPLHFLISEYHDRLPGMGAKHCGVKGAARERKPKASRKELQKENASLAAANAQLVQANAALLGTVASLEDEIITLRLLLAGALME